jgi:hypothetical protein
MFSMPPAWETRCTIPWFRLRSWETVRTFFAPSEVQYRRKGWRPRWCSPKTTRRFHWRILDARWTFASVDSWYTDPMIWQGKPYFRGLTSIFVTLWNLIVSMSVFSALSCGMKFGAWHCPAQSQWYSYPDDTFLQRDSPWSSTRHEGFRCCFLFSSWWVGNYVCGTNACVRGPKKQNSVKARKRLFENLQATIYLIHEQWRPESTSFLLRSLIRSLFLFPLSFPWVSLETQSETNNWFRDTFRCLHLLSFYDLRVHLVVKSFRFLTRKHVRKRMSFVEHLS